MRNQPLRWVVIATFLATGLSGSNTLAQTTGGISSGSTGGFPTGSTGTNGGGTSNSLNTQAQAGQLNASDLGIDSTNFFQGGVQRSGAIGAQRTAVKGFSIIENPQGAGSMAQSGSAAGTAGAAGTNSRSRTQSNTRRTGSTFGSGGLGGGLGGSGGSLGGTNRGGQQGAAAKPVLRTRIVVSPELTQNVQTVQGVSSAPVSVSVPGLSPQLSGVRVQVSKGTAVMRGRVAGAADRDLAERLMLLDPSVNEIKSEVVVGTRPAQITPVTPQQ